MTTFLLEAPGSAPFDLAWAGLRSFTLWRRGTVVALRVPEVDAAALRRTLALHGVRALERPLDPSPPGEGIHAVGTGLRPVAIAPEELDLLEVRVLSLAAATALVLARPHRRWPIGAARRARTRALLHGSEVLFAIEREAWCGRATLAAARPTLRPLIFDRGARPHPRTARASEGAVSAWIRG